MPGFVPFEQVTAELIAGLVISAGQKGNAAAIVKRATTALAIASSFQQLAQGNASTAIAALQEALTNNSLDPAVQAALIQAIGLVTQQATVLAAIQSGVPLVGATAEAIALNVAAGISAAANAELAKYNTTAPKA